MIFIFQILNNSSSSTLKHQLLVRRVLYIVNQKMSTFVQRATPLPSPFAIALLFCMPVNDSLAWGHRIQPSQTVLVTFSNWWAGDLSYQQWKCPRFPEGLSASLNAINRLAARASTDTVKNKFSSCQYTGSAYKGYECYIPCKVMNKVGSRRLSVMYFLL